MNILLSNNFYLKNICGLSINVNWYIIFTKATFVSILTKLSKIDLHIKCKFVDCSKFKTLSENHMGFNRQTVRHTKTILGGAVDPLKPLTHKDWR